MENQTLFISNFKRFLLHIFYTALFVFILGFSFSFIFEKYVILGSEISGASKVNRIINNQDGNEIVILGSSRAQSNYVPSILGKNYFNYGINGTSSNIWLFFLEEELKKDKNTPIIVNIDPSGFGEGYGDINNYILNYNQTEKILNESQKKYSYRIPFFKYFGEYDYFFKTFINEKVNFTKVTDRGGMFEKNAFTREYFDRLVSKRKQEKVIFNNNNLRVNLLKELVSKTNRKIYIVFSPNHSSLYENITNQNAIDKFKQEITKFKNVIVFDFNKLSLEDKYFKDTSHLNYEGAVVFSNLLIKKIAKN